MKGQIARLTKLVEDHPKIMAMYSQGSSPFPVQPAPHTFPQYSYPNHQLHVSTANNALPGNLLHQLAILKAHSKCPSNFYGSTSTYESTKWLKGKPRGHKTSRDKARWDPISVTYMKLFLKLLEARLIAPVYTPPL